MIDVTDSEIQKFCEAMTALDGVRKAGIGIVIDVDLKNPSVIPLVLLASFGSSTPPTSPASPPAD
jgi:hypothetical protein